MEYKMIKVNDNKRCFKRCYESHPPLPLGDGKVVYGGSCGNPVRKGADMYVGLDEYTYKHNGMGYPWQDRVSFSFVIPDMGVPHSLKDFRELIDYLIESINNGWEVHIGCIGGHGRTGLVMSALVMEMGITDDAIVYVRKNYCSKAVESKVQVDFLVKHFGIRSAKANKEASVYPLSNYTPPLYAPTEVGNRRIHPAGLVNNLYPKN